MAKRMVSCWLAGWVGAVLYSSLVCGAESLSSDSQQSEEEEGSGSIHEVVSSLEESWDSRLKPAAAAAAATDSAKNLNKQELLKQYHLRKHVENLESSVQNKEEVVDKLRWLA